MSETYEFDNDPPTTLTTTIHLPADGILRGINGSRKVIITSSANPIVQVDSNFGDITKSAVIENIILRGTDQTEATGQTAILLEDVYNCQIRNVGIQWCKEGIKLRTNQKWCQANHIEHVRMKYIRKGILFEKSTGSTGDFGFTFIADTSMSLQTYPASD